MVMFFNRLLLPIELKRIPSKPASNQSGRIKATQVRFFSKGGLGQEQIIFFQQFATKISRRFPLDITM